MINPKQSLSRHPIYQGDARSLSMIDTECVHLVCASPPYGPLKRYPDRHGQLGNIGSYERFLDELDQVWAECFRILTPGGRIACIIGDVYETDEYVKWFAPVWNDVTGQLRRDHPAPYPLEVPRRLIRMFSFAGDIVVDPFAGTGTTALAAIETGRNSISVELEPTYIESIQQRLAALGSVAADIRFFRCNSPETNSLAAH